MGKNKNFIHVFLLKNMSIDNQIKVCVCVCGEGIVYRNIPGNTWSKIIKLDYHYFATLNELLVDLSIVFFNDY